MISILCTQYEREITTLDEQIQKCYSDYCLIVTSPRFKKKEQELKEHIEGYTMDIIRTKENNT